MPTVSVVHLDETNPAVLFHRYRSTEHPQQAILELSLRDGELRADYNGEPGDDGYPAEVAQGLIRWYSIPCLTAQVANQLLDSVAPLAQRVLDGARITDGWNNATVCLDTDANAAEEEIAAMCNPKGWGTESTVEEWTASDWYHSFTTDEALIETLGITAETTDARLQELAEEEEREASGSGNAGYTMLTGVVEYLTERREQLREALRGELEDAARQIQNLTSRRNKLLRRITAWGDRERDSSRALGALGGLSHTQVLNIVRETQT